MFEMFLLEGFRHILDPTGYDHILFVVALTSLYSWVEWQKVLVLVTAFTIGHSVTLILATYRLMTINVDLIEFLIPLTIITTGIYNVLAIRSDSKLVCVKMPLNYSVALLFGLVHGLGFSILLRSMLSLGDSLTFLLFAFNIGLELGQIVIVAGTLTVAYVFVHFLKLKQGYWAIALAILISSIALYLAIDRFSVFVG